MTAFGCVATNDFLDIECSTLVIDSSGTMELDCASNWSNFRSLSVKPSICAVNMAAGGSLSITSAEPSRLVAEPSRLVNPPSQTWKDSYHPQQLRTINNSSVIRKGLGPCRHYCGRCGWRSGRACGRDCSRDVYAPFAQEGSRSVSDCSSAAADGNWV